MLGTITKFIPAVGLLGLAVYHLSIGDIPGAGTAAYQAALAAEQAIGLNATPPTPPAN